MAIWVSCFAIPLFFVFLIYNFIKDHFFTSKEEKERKKEKIREATRNFNKKIVQDPLPTSAESTPTETVKAESIPTEKVKAESTSAEKVKAE